jgi:hypothetical protein
MVDDDLIVQNQQDMKEILEKYGANHDESSDEEENDHDEPEMDDLESKKDKKPEFSKNSIISISRKAGIKCISQCGIEKIKTLLHDQIHTMTSHLASFYTGNGKTITKQIMIDFLESKNIHFTN